MKSYSAETFAPSERRWFSPNGCSSPTARAPRLSWKLGSSGVAPAGVVYVLAPDGEVKVCGVGCGTAPFGEAPVSASNVNLRLSVRSFASVRRALMTGSIACTRPPPSL